MRDELDLNQIVAMNIVELRKEAKWTQVELADKLHYTDKAVSKWERGESIPELVTLKKIADLFGVTIDYLTSEKPPNEKKDFMLPKIIQTNRIIITAIVTSFVFIIATIIFVYGYLYLEQIRFWTAFVWAVPFSAFLLIFFNRQWGKRKFSFYVYSIFLWSLIAAIFIETMQYGTWMLFILGIPIQITIVLFSFLKK
ncbi:MAG TPA: helix-turn-helix transcriptional regulator [Bacilli bacterium]|nr:helix-turn-helix transcriptional regulator [Bacilli bacterium]